MGLVAKTLLKNVNAYLSLQWLIGAHRLRHLCIERLAPKAGDRLLDVGCGPAYYIDRLPQVEYYGFDTDQTYIDYARGRFGHRATFHCGLFTPEHAKELPPIDGVLLMGLLHHQSDAEVSELLRLLGRVLAANGKVVTLDTCFDASQSRFRRWMAEADRGEHVRYGREFEALAARHFEDVRGELVTDLVRIPSTYYVMTLTSPRAGNR